MAYVKVVQSGNLLEVYEYEKPLPQQNYRKRKRNTTVGNRKYSFRRRDNVGRLKKSFQRLIRANLARDGSPLLFTFTMAEVVRVQLGYECFSGFIQRLRRQYGKDFRYIAVPEFQKRGAVHFHVLFWGLPEKIAVDERSSRTIQRLWGYGYVDCILTDGSPRLASYLSKYMQKAVFDDRLLYQKAYVCSRNALRPMSFPFVQAVANLDLIWGTDELLVYKKSFDTMWLGRCDYSSYELKNINHDN